MVIQHEVSCGTKEEGAWEKGSRGTESAPFRSPGKAGGGQGQARGPVEPKTCHPAWGSGAGGWGLGAQAWGLGAGGSGLGLGRQ